MDEFPNKPKLFPQKENECGGRFGSMHCPYKYICEINPTNVELIKNVKQSKYEIVPYESWSLPEES